MADTYFYGSGRKYEVGDKIKSYKRDLKEEFIAKRVSELLLEHFRPFSKPSRADSLFLEVGLDFSKAYKHVYKVKIIKGKPFVTDLRRFSDVAVRVRECCDKFERNGREFENEQEFLELVKEHEPKYFKEIMRAIKQYWGDSGPFRAAEVLLDGIVEVVEVVK